MAAQIGIRLIPVDTFELDNPRYRANAGDRCYFCKDELFTAISRIVEETGIRWVAYGENADDLGDHRPGRIAASAHGVRAPFSEAASPKTTCVRWPGGFSLPVWDKPAFACLSSRFPVGTEITAELLRQVEQAEDVLWSLGFRQFRVRHHGPVARIEVPAVGFSPPHRSGRAVRLRRESRGLPVCHDGLGGLSKRRASAVSRGRRHASGALHFPFSLHSSPYPVTLLLISQISTLVLPRFSSPASGT